MDEETPAVPAEPEKRSSPLKWVALLVIAALCGGAILIYARHGKTPKPAAIVREPLEILHLETFVVNLADDDHTYLRVGIDLGVEAKKSSAKEKEKGETNPRIPVVRDIVLAVLTSSTSADLSSAEGRRKLKEQLISQLAANVPELGTREIYITEFLIQR
jgi:flagellar basal body-associated protein FliL